MTEKLVLPREFPGVHYYSTEEEEAVLRVIQSKSPFRYYGAAFLEEANHLEDEFRERLGRQYAQVVSSGTNGLAAAMAALGIGPGQEVLVPGFLWVSTVSPIVRAGAIPVLVEIDDSFTMCPRDAEEKITERTTLIVPVHMCGVPTNMPAIMEIARRHGLRVLEDCAQSNGASLHGKQTGSFADIAMFSFQMNKAITAGEGGILVTDDEELALRCNAAHDVGVPWVDNMPDDQHRIHLWGMGSRMSELAAAVIRAQLSKLDRIIEHMRVSKHRIKECLSDLKGITWRRVDDPKGDGGAFLIARFESEENAISFSRYARKLMLPCTYLPEYGLHVYYNIQALVQKSSNCPDGFPWSHPANRECQPDYVKGTLPQTDRLLERSILLPVPSCLTKEQEDQYASAFREAYEAVFN
jgi:dTDP-4-amino-4,6-dideoxygalactose transaminase